MIRLLADALAPVQQQYLHQARQMQALSFAVHIPLVAFGTHWPFPRSSSSASHNTYDRC